MKTAWVYFIESKNGDLIKIGTSIDVEGRMRDIRERGRLLAVEPGSYQREKELHRQFAELREYGEWFRVSSSLLEYIAALPSDPTGLVEASSTDGRIKWLIPGSEDALRRVLEAQAKVRNILAEMDRERPAMRRERAEAIEDAIAEGFTLKTLGQALDGISAQRVQQMRKAK